MKIMKNHFFMKIVLLVSFLIIISESGCAKRKDNSDHVSDFLRELINNSEDINLRERAKLAMSKLEDDVMESEPFLISAMMGTVGVEDGEILSITLIIYDEDEDFIGFMVEEERVDSNNIVTTRSVEKYPVFTYLPYSSNLDWLSVPILVRDKNQRKSDEEWLKYINTPLQKQKEDYKKQSKKNWTWRRALPPIWLSIPDPGKLNIYLRVYDRAGHLSERVPLVDKRKK